MAFRAAFYKGTHSGLPGVFNRLIRWRERGEYSHMELVFRNGESASSSWMDGGVRFKLIDFDPADWDFIELPDEMEPAARGWFMQHEGKAYDYWSDIRFATGFIKSSPDKWMCSESCMAALGFMDAFRFEPNTAHSVLMRMRK